MQTTLCSVAAAAPCLTGVLVQAGQSVGLDELLVEVTGADVIEESRSEP